MSSQFSNSMLDGANLFSNSLGLKKGKTGKKASKTTKKAVVKKSSKRAPSKKAQSKKSSKTGKSVKSSSKKQSKTKTQPITMKGGAGRKNSKGGDKK